MLAKFLGYDFQEDVHRDLFALFPQKEPGKQFFDLSPIKHRLILWPRGHYKTSATVVDIVQTILCYPDVRFLLMQGGLKLTKLWVKEIKSHFIGTNPKSQLPKLFPEFCAAKMGNAEGFTVPARKRMHLPAPTVAAASPKAISTGQHCDAFVADDLVHAKNFRNVELLDQLESDFNHFTPLIDPGGYTQVTGTRYSYADNYGRIIQRNKGEWLISIREACDDNFENIIFPARKIPDGRTVGFTAELLRQIYQDDPEMFFPQYRNKIIASKRHLFPRELLLSAVRSTKHEEYPAHTPCIFTVDIAESKKAESDSSVITVARLDGRGRIWIPQCIGGQFTSSQLAVVILQQMLTHRPMMIYFEKQNGSGFFVDYLQQFARDKGLSVPVDFLKADRSKDAKFRRIESLDGELRSHRLFFCSSIADWDKFEEEFTQFPRGRHDDRPDCVALAVQQLRGQAPLGRPIATWARTLTSMPAFVEQPERKEAPILGDGFTC